LVEPVLLTQSIAPKPGKAAERLPIKSSGLGKAGLGWEWAEMRIT
jgi:hypothetical protein